MGRFISSDVAVSTGQGLTGNNAFAYCGNAPTSRSDFGGNAWETVWDIFSLGSSIIDVAMNPADPWAWIGLAGDIVDVAVPFVGGIGETARALKTASQATEILDAASDAKKGWKVGEDITKLTKAGNVPSWSTIRSRYWKNKAHYFATDYSKSDLERMKKGLAPLVEYIDGKKYPMELHHPNGRKGKNIFTFIEVTPWKHAEIDPFRHF